MLSLLYKDMSFSIGDKVSLKVPLPYLKSSDPMPMLRPPDLVSLEEFGDVIAIKSFDVVEVRFRRGSFLIPTVHLQSELKS